MLRQTEPPPSKTWLPRPFRQNPPTGTHAVDSGLSQESIPEHIDGIAQEYRVKNWYRMGYYPTEVPSGSPECAGKSRVVHGLHTVLAEIAQAIGGPPEFSDHGVRFTMELANASLLDESTAVAR